MSRPSDDLPHSSGLLRRTWAHLFHRIKPDSHARLAQYFVFNKAIGQVITHTDQESVLLESLCSLAVQSTSVALAWVCRFENDASLCTLADAGETGYLDSFAERRMGLPVDEGPLLRVWREQSPLFNEPFTSGALRRAWLQNTRAYQLSSIAILPIHRDHQPWALLVLYDRDQQAFPRDCQIVLESIARQISEALEDWTNILRERKQREQQMLLGAVLGAAEEGVMLIDAHHRVLYVNPSFTRMTGYTLAEIDRQGLHQLLGPQTETVVLPRIDAALSNEGLFNETILCYRRDGQTFWNHLNIIPTHNHTEKMTHYLCIQRV
jgi:PAS domain S-box-containing protein